MAMNSKFNWTVSVQFNAKDKSIEQKDKEMFYEEFKSRILRSVDSAKETDFSDKHLSFWHVCQKPAEVLEYFYFLNPLPSGDVLTNARVTIQRTRFVNKR